MGAMTDREVSTIYGTARLIQAMAETVVRLCESLKQARAEHEEVRVRMELAEAEKKGRRES